MRSCPNCHSEIGFAALARPRFSTKLRCPTCSAELKFRGLFAWGAEIAAIIASLAIYGAIKGNVLESLVALPVMLAIFFFQYRFAYIELAEAQMR
jgi:hypothetical protein